MTGPFSYLSVEALLLALLLVFDLGEHIAGNRKGAAEAMMQRVLIDESLFAALVGVLP